MSPPHVSTRMVFPTEEYCERSIPGIPGAAKFQFYIRVIDIPGELEEFLKVNPRRDTPTKVHTGIINTALNDPKKMVLRNAGLILAAQNKRDVAPGISFQFADPRRHGLIDGNNSRAAFARSLIQAEEEGKGLEDCYIECSVYTGLQQGQVQDVASGQNIRKSVQQHSLMHYHGSFDLIKRSLGRTIVKDIAFFEGDKGTMDIKFLLQLMMSLNIARYPDARTYPNTYAHAGRVLRDFKDDLEDKDPSPAELLSRNVQEIYGLYKLLEEKRGDLWRGVKGVGGGSSKYAAVNPKAYAAIDLQFFAALRPLLAWDLAAGQFEFWCSHALIMEECAPDLIERIKATYDKAPRHIKNDQVGKNADLAEVLYERAHRWIES